MQGSSRGRQAEFPIGHRDHQLPRQRKKIPPQRCTAIHGLWWSGIRSHESTSPHGQAIMMVEQYIMSLPAKNLQRFGLADTRMVTAATTTMCPAALSL
eukprot:3008275-Pyramimonas_sp.AAC.1